MKKVNKDPFANGTEHCIFEYYNCDKCVKNSWWNEKANRFVNADEKNQPRCSIQRDIVTRMYCSEPIKQKTIDICRNFTLNGVLCPYLRTERKRYAKKQNNNQLNLFQV